MFNFFQNKKTFFSPSIVSKKLNVPSFYVFLVTAISSECFDLYIEAIPFFLNPDSRHLVNILLPSYQSAYQRLKNMKFNCDTLGSCQIYFVLNLWFNRETIS